MEDLEWSGVFRGCGVFCLLRGWCFRLRCTWWNACALSAKAILKPRSALFRFHLYLQAAEKGLFIFFQEACPINL